MIPLYLHDPAGELVQRLSVSSCTLGRNYDKIGEMEITCEVPHNFGKDYRIVVDLEGENRVLWLIQDWEYVPMGTKNLITFYCQDGKRLFDTRIVLAYNDTAAGYKINYPQVVAAEIINENMYNHVWTERNLIGMVQAVVPTALAASWTVWEGEVAWKIILDCITDLQEYGRNTNNPFYVDLLVDAQGGRTFSPVILRRAGVSRSLNTMQLARYGISFRERYSGSDSVTRMFSLGAGEGSLALYVYYPTQVTVARASNPFWYTEGIITSGNEDDLDALTTTARTGLQAASPKTSLIMEGAGPVRGLWGRIIGYGDELTLTHNDKTYTMTVTGYSMSWEGVNEPTVSIVCTEGY